MHTHTVHCVSKKHPNICRCNSRKHCRDFSFER